VGLLAVLLGLALPATAEAAPGLWTPVRTLPAAPADAQSFSAARSTDGRIWTLARTPAGLVARVWSPAAHRWLAFAAPQLSDSHDGQFALAFAAPGRVYLFQRWYDPSFGERARLEWFDPPARAWRRLATPPVAGGTPVGCAGRLWLVSANRMAAYDPAHSRWSGGGAGPGVDGPAVCASGHLLVFAPDSTRVFNPDTHAWHTAPGMPRPRAGAVAATVNGSVWVMGGRDATGRPSPLVDVFSATTGHWSARRPLLRQAAPLAAVAGVSGRMLALGGLVRHDGEWVPARLVERSPIGRSLDEQPPALLAAGPAIDAMVVTYGDPDSMRGRLTAATHDASGTCSVEWREGANGGAPDGTDGTARFWQLGTAYATELRLTDCAGNATPWLPGPAFTPTLHQEDEAAYTGAWSNGSLPDAGTFRSSSEAGAGAAFTYAGVAVAWLGTVSGDGMHGQAQVALDGGDARILDTADPGICCTYGALLWSAVTPQGGQHMVQITDLGTAGRPDVDVAGFVVLG